MGSRISPFDSKLTVSVKRFTELRHFASEMSRRAAALGKRLSVEHDFPFHTRLFGSIKEEKLEDRRQAINAYLEDLCADENAVRHCYFLAFFDFDDGRNAHIDDDEKALQARKHLEDEFRLQCMEETLEVIGLNGGLDPSYDDESDSDDEFRASPCNAMDAQTPLLAPFEVAYDLHHYKDPEYRLVAAIFDVIQQQLEATTPKHREEVHRRTGSAFLDSVHNSAMSRMAELDSIHGASSMAMAMSPRRPGPRRASGGVVASGSLRHHRAKSIIESSFTPAKVLAISLSVCGVCHFLSR